MSTEEIKDEVETTDEAFEEQESEETVTTTIEDEEDVDSEDSLTFSNGVIEKIVALGLRDVPGVVGMKGGFINRVQDAFGFRDARRRCRGGDERRGPS